MALLTPMVGSEAGYVESLVGPTPGTGDTYLNTGKERLIVNNASGGSINVTINAAHACEFGVTHNKVVAVGPGVRRVLGPYAASRYADPDTGLTTAICSATASVTIGVDRAS